MRGNNSFKFAFCLLGFLPLSISRAEPTTRPASNETVPVVSDVDVPVTPGDAKGDANSGTSSIDGSKPRRPDRGNFADGARQRFGQRPGNAVTPADIDEAMKFMKDHSPNRLAAIESMPEDRKTRFKEIATRNYLSWVSIRNSDPKLFDLVQQRVELEDNVFGLVVQLRKDSPDQKAETQARLHDEVSKLVDVGIQERQRRLDNLANTVAEQQKVLAADKANRDALVEDRLKSILSDGKGLFSGNGNNGNGQLHHGGPPRQPGDNRPSGS